MVSILGWVLIGLGVLLVLWGIMVFNRIVRLENRIDNAWGQIDVQLKRRADLIPNLIETVKGYKDFEKDVLESVTQARAGLMQARDAGDRQGAMRQEGFLEQALGKLFAVAEAYPDLKANQNFLQLQDELTHTENKVAFARQAYNDAVLAFNNAVEVFPGLVVAGMMGKKEREMFEVSEADRELPQVSF